MLHFVWRAALVALLLVPDSGLLAQKTSVKDIEKRVEALLARMTLDEKIGQLNQVVGDIATGTDVSKDDLLTQLRAGRIGSVLSHTNFDNKIKIQQTAVKDSRLGIPVIFGFDVIHGYKTIFPIPLAQAASWDMGLIERIERVAAEEAAADGQHWTFSPMVDVARDPRWGRVMEGAGEDPLLNSRVAEARIRGFQGDDLSAPNTVAACTKHYAGYGFAEAGRDYNTVDVSEQRLREMILPPFEAAARAGSATFMNAFNTLNGIPASMNKMLVTDILRGEWGWRGMVVSDWNSFGETIVHGAAADDVDASAKCLTAGSDMDMAGGTFQRGLKKALDQRRVTQPQIDEAVRRVLRLKFQLGLFDDPFRYLDANRRAATLEKPEYRALAREAAAKSMVLLKNEGNVLPLIPGRSVKKIAVVGPFANSVGNKDYMSFWTLGLGMRAYDSTKVVTPAQALQPELTRLGFEVQIVPVCTDRPCDESTRETIAAVARTVDLVIVCVGERGFDSGESRSVASLELPRGQDKVVEYAAQAGKPVVLVVFNARPLVFPPAIEKVPAILLAWQPGFEAGNALTDVLTGRVNPSGKLPLTFPRNLGQVPIYYNSLSTGRPQTKFGTMWTSGYLDSPADPAWPFGFGLSYTTFQYSDLKVQTRVRMNEAVSVSVSVANTGTVAGEEVVQLYLRDVAADVARPVKELKAFEKVTLAPGERRTVTFRLAPADLQYWAPRNGDSGAAAQRALVKKADLGIFKVFAGGNSRDVLESEFQLVK